MGETTGVRLSADGQWWWDGEAWVSAISPDGLWIWDGRHWRFAVEDAGDDPARLVAELDRLAAERFSEAGAVLASRAEEWEAPARLQALLAGARERLVRLEAIDDQLEYGRPERGLGGLLGRAGAQRRQLENERDSLESELGPLLAEIGQDAPQPSLKEADELLHAARGLTAAATEVASALAAVTEAELEVRSRVAEAEAEVQRLLAEQEGALAPARQAIEEARARQEERLRSALEQLREACAHQPGEVVARLGDLSLYETVVEWPGGRAPAAGAELAVGPAAALAASQPDVLEALAMAGDSSAAELHEEELTGGGRDFLLLTTRLGAWLRPLEAGEREPAEAFAAQLAETARAAGRLARERSARVRKASTAFEAAAADRSELEAAETEYARLSSDGGFDAALTAAQARVEAAAAERSALDSARGILEARLATLMTPPAPLGAEG